MLDIESQLQDWTSAIAHARSRTDVDHSRIVLWGSSFGGGHVIVAAARDQQVEAVVAQLQAELLETKQNLRRLELLEERKLEEWKTDEARLTQQEMDELSILKFARG